jgi:hypothetical protein
MSSSNQAGLDSLEAMKVIMDQICSMATDKADGFLFFSF